MARYRHEESTSFHRSTGVRRQDDMGHSPVGMVTLGATKMKDLAKTPTRYVRTAWWIVGVGVVVHLVRLL